MSFLFDLIRSVFLRMLELIWSGKTRIANSLSIYIKTNNGKTVHVDLNPKWDIKNVKEIVAKKLDMPPEEIKIIFAGKELHNSTTIEVIDYFTFFLLQIFIWFIEIMINITYMQSMKQKTYLI